MSTKSTALVARAGRGKSAPVSITPAGLALVEELAGEGQDFRSIAKRLGINHQTFNVLRKKDEALAEAVERGQAVLADEVTHLLLKAARKGNVVAAIFLAKARLGWTDTPQPKRPEVAVQINLPGAMDEAAYVRMVEAEVKEAADGDA
ncbi:hypothetical protein NYR54_00940 [Chelativorans sp. SCAU2101]|uniref:Uncharacterized protein n=1 Tax=Chelativorans petroleitrophicus TaxID=2975484 RepID=A0A9X2X5F5_9HYPH|nr:hypothetical protein [Chelativorans petroleitrophicus]MCT8988863.1 hypothetical protein [Chelativorans petroleitrophicus]